MRREQPSPRAFQLLLAPVLGRPRQRQVLRAEQAEDFAIDCAAEAAAHFNGAHLTLRIGAQGFELALVEVYEHGLFKAQAALAANTRRSESQGAEVRLTRFCD